MLIFCSDQFENGSNMIVSILFKMIQDFYTDNKFLPPILFLNLDNCGRENKVSYTCIFKYVYIFLISESVSPSIPLCLS